MTTKTAEKTVEPALPLEGAASPEQRGVREPGQVTATEHRGRAKTAVAVSQPVSEHQALLAMISAAAANPEVNVDKLERLLAMRDRAEARAKEDAFNEAMALTQEAMGPIRADATNPSTKSRYASHAALDRALRPIYTPHGFALSYNTEEGGPEGHIRVVCYVTCKGHSRKYQADMAADGKGAKGGDVMTKTHATGSALTYGQRYLLKMIFNIAVDRDDDGNSAGRTVLNNVDPDVPKINQHQIDALVEKCEAVGCPRPKFLEWAQVARFEDIPASLFDGCMTGLDSFRKAK